MQVCTLRDIPAILELLRTDIPNCFYMYVDISKYGISHPDMHLWLERKDGEIVAVVMKYFNSMQVYTLPGANLEDIALQIKEKDVPIITGRADDCDSLAMLLTDRYECSHGWTFEVDHFRPFPSPDPIEPARDEELAECAALVCMDEGIGGYYESASLARLFIERRQEGMGRNYVIRKNGRIIAHIATYAEYENLAVSSGLIVHPDWRTEPYGTWLESYLINELISEKKRVFSFLRADKRMKYYKALGITKCWRNGKLTRKGA